MTEAMAQQHERDGRGWKAEWVALPEACLLAAAALHIAAGLLAGLTVDAEAMRRNLARYGPVSERALALLAPRLGVRRAQEQLQEAFGASAFGASAEQVLVEAGLFGPAEARELTAQPDAGSCQDMADLVVERARAARAAEPTEWP
jgi:adenylosuccinate lyase